MLAEAGFPCTCLPTVSHLGSLFRVKGLVLLCPPWKMNPYFPKDQNLRHFLTDFISAFRHHFITMPTAPAKFCHLLGRWWPDPGWQVWRRWVSSKSWCQCPSFFYTLQKQGSQHFRLMQEVISIVGMVAGDLLGTRSKAVWWPFYLQELNSEHKEEDLKILSYFIFSVAIDSLPQCRIFWRFGCYSGRKK